MTRVVCAALSLLAAGVVLLRNVRGAQPPAAAFAAASIKPNVSGSGDHDVDTDPGRLRATNVSLRRLLADAYQLRDQQIAGPPWLDSEFFDIDARSDFATTSEQLDVMLRALLDQRFRIRTHRELRPMRVYLLVSGGKPRMPAATAAGDTATARHGGVIDVFAQCSAACFANVLSRRLDRPVVDKTGLSGLYTFKLSWTPDTPDARLPADPNAPPDIFAAIRQQLGLRLTAGRSPVELLVIDSILRAPLPN